jgi:fructokinase
LHAALAAKRSRLFVSFDPNWRPSLWADPVEARGLIWDSIPQADVIHCAYEEWEFITGAGDLEAGARKILQAGPKLVVVTQGEDGCYFDNGASRGQVPGFRVNVVDPLGAGDAFVAAMLSRLMVLPRGEVLSEELLREIMTYANAAGALTCTKRGVIPALPAADEITRFLSRTVGA